MVEKGLENLYLPSFPDSLATEIFLRSFLRILFSVFVYSKITRKINKIEIENKHRIRQEC